MDKKDSWPKEGKLKNGLIILLIVIVTAILITLFEEKTNLKASKKIAGGIAILCVAIWIYKPAAKKEI